MNRKWPSGQTSANTLPTTRSTGTNAASGSQRCCASSQSLAEESADAPRLSPITNRSPSGTSTAQSFRHPEGIGPSHSFCGAMKSSSSIATPLISRRPSASQHWTVSPPTPITRFTR